MKGPDPKLRNEFCPQVFCSYRKCYPGANSFEINEIQEEETEVAITKRW